MIAQDLLIQSVTEAAAEVFGTMLEMAVEFTGFATGDTGAENGLISLIGITGDWAGAGVFCCPPELAATICGRMLGTEVETGGTAVDEEIMDVVAEVANMVIGNIKNALEPITGPLAISVPTVIHARNFHFRNTTGREYANLTFTTEGQTFQVRLSLAPNMEQAAGHARIPSLGMAHF